jgi:threonylcarbamoyladenosine tRNA methylthiotransferase MtaB
MLRCSFCIIPYVRPHQASRRPEHILEEIRRLVDNGYREVVLTGIHLGHYGVDWNRNSSKDRWVRLSHLVRQIAQLPGDFRVRLSSIEATEVTRELVDAMADCGERVAPHLHISMQSGSDAVLRRMRRRWGRQRFIDRCRLVQERLDRPAITTDIIVGFPGETEREFQETIDAARAVGFSKIHIFPFSPRRGTPAADMPDQVPKQVQQERSHELAVVETELREKYYGSLIGRKLRVLVESEERRARGEGRGIWTGTSCRYATVQLAGKAADGGRFVDAIAGQVCGERIVGQRMG